MNDQPRYKVQHRPSGTVTVCLHSLEEALEWKAELKQKGHIVKAWKEERLEGSGWTQTEII